MADQIQRKMFKDKRARAVIAKVALLESRKRKDIDLIDQDMVDIVERNGSGDILSMVEGATFFAAS